MAYKLAEEDKLCGVIYPTYEGFKPIPKATCDMLESKCEQTIIVKCGESSDEGKKPESQSGSASASTAESTSVSESTSESNSTSESTSESQSSTSESTSESTSTESTSTSESTSQSESVSTSDSTSVSQSTSESTSNSVSNSESKSESSSISESTSESTSSVSTSESTSTSTESTSTSKSNSVSESTSTSASSSESTSVSGSTTEITTTSESTSVSTSESASSSTENSNTPEEPKPTPEPQPEPVPTPVLTNEELDTIVSGKLSTNTTLGNYMVNQNNTITLIGEAPLEDIEAYKKEITDKVGDIPELKDYTVEVLVNKIPGDNVGDKSTGAPLYTKVVKITKPNGDVYQSEPMSIGTTTETNIDLLEALPRVEDKFSKIIAKDGQVVEVPEVSNDDKRAFEDKIINDLKAKLPEGTVVEAVLEGPKYEKGSEVLSGKTNYVLNVRTTLNGVVSEQTYNVPHTEEAPREEPEAPEVSDDEIRDIIGKQVFAYGVVNRDYNNNITNIEDGHARTVTPELLKVQEKIFEENLKDVLGDKVSEVHVELEQQQHIGNKYDGNDSSIGIFIAEVTITKHDGASFNFTKPVTTAVIDTL